MSRHLAIGLAVAGLIALAAPEAGALPLSSTGGRCGGFAGLRCQPGLVCRMPSRRGADLMGVCVPAAGPESRPQVCTRIYSPVCGRDGRTYGNDCERRARGVPLLRPGRC